MDELKMVERMFTEPLPSMDTTALGRDRLLRLTRGEAPGDPGGTRTRTQRWSVGIGLAGVAAATAGVIAAGSLASSGMRSQTLSARQVLLAAATKSAATTSGPGRYTRIRTETGMVQTVGAKGHEYGLQVRRVDDRWYPNTPRGAGWYVRQSLGARPATPADEAAWRAAGSPQRWRPTCHVSVPPSLTSDPKSLHCPSIEAKAGRAETEWMGGGPAAFLKTPDQPDPAKLSPDPATLTKQLLGWTHGGGLAGPVDGDAGQLWAAVITVLFTPQGPVSPHVRAAGYRILAGLPGVHALGQIGDPDGRMGQGLSMKIHDIEDRIIVDPRTGAPLAVEEYATSNGTGMRAGQQISYTMVLRSGPTDEEPPHTGACTPVCH